MRPWWECREAPPAVLWALLCAVVLSGCREPAEPPPTARQPAFEEPRPTTGKASARKASARKASAGTATTGTATKRTGVGAAERRPAPVRGRAATAGSGSGVAQDLAIRGGGDLRLSMRGSVVEARGMTPGTSLSVVADGPLVLGWLRADGDGVAAADFGHPLPPGEYSLAGQPAATPRVVVAGDREAWRADMQKQLRRVQFGLISQRAILQRMAGSALDGADYRVGKAGDFDERRWRAALTRWTAGLDEVRERLRQLRLRHGDLAAPERYRKLSEVAQLLAALARVRSRQLYHKYRREPHPDDLEDAAAPEGTLVTMRRRISMLLR